MATRLHLRNSAADIGGNFWEALPTPGSVGGSGTLRATNTTVGGTEIQLTATSGGTVMEWISGYAADAFTLSGTVNVSMIARESATSVNAKLRIKLWKREPDTTETLVATLDMASELTTTDATRTWSGTPTSTSFARNDRLVARFYAINRGTMGGGSVASRTDGTSAANWFQITEDVTFTETENPESSTYEESVSLAVSLQKSTVVANNISLAVTAGVIGNVSQEYAFIADTVLTLPLVLNYTLSTQAQLEPALTLSTEFDLSQLCALVLQDTLTFALLLDTEQVGGTLYGASVDFALLLNMFALPSSAYDDSLTFGLSLGLEAADNLGDIELSVDLEFIHDVSFERGRVWENTLSYAMTLGDAQAPGNIIDFSLSWGLTLLLEQAGDRGVLENSVSFGIAQLLFNDVVTTLDLPLDLGVTLEQALVVQGVLVPTLTFGLQLGFSPSVLVQFETTLLAGLFVGAGITGGRILENAITLGVRPGLVPEIVDYDLLISITSDLDLGLFASFETWLSKKLSGSDSYTAATGSAGSFTAKSGNATTFLPKGNKEDPGWQDGNVSEG